MRRTGPFTYLPFLRALVCAVEDALHPILIIRYGVPTAWAPRAPSIGWTLVLASMLALLGCSAPPGAHELPPVDADAATAPDVAPDAAPSEACDAGHLACAKGQQTACIGGSCPTGTRAWIFGVSALPAPDGSACVYAPQCLTFGGEGVFCCAGE
jgi:hypothetical protein